MTDFAQTAEQSRVTVEQILDEAPNVPGAAFNVPRLDSCPLRLQSGIYFDLPEADYHAQPALSCSGIKKLASSPMLFWATCAWLNAEIEPEEDKAWAIAGRAYHARILEGRDVFNQRFAVALNKADFDDLCVTVDDLKTRITSLGEDPKGKKKEDFVAQLLEIEPDAPIWENLVARHAEANEGKTMIGFDLVKKIEIAARMIEQHDELHEATTGGYPEVSLFWTCAKTGIPMKARVDYLKVDQMVDLKSYADKFERSPERAINAAIANNRYFIQPTVYWEGAEAVKRLIRSEGSGHIHGTDEQRQFALRWVASSEPPRWLWIFQLKGVAPITRGVFFLRDSALHLVSTEIIAAMKRRFMRSAEVFGCDPWLDVAHCYDLADEDIPQWASDI